MRYEAQYIPASARSGESANWRITDTKTDSRVATCYLEENANLVTGALNFYNDHPTRSLVVKG